MPCVGNEHIVICRPSVDAWTRFFTCCPVCKCRRLCLEEFQDWYGSRCTCLTCGTGWMEREYRPAPKRERAQIVASAKQRIKNYIATGRKQGYADFFARLKASEASHATTEREG